MHADYGLTAKQVDVLLSPIRDHRVKFMDGMSHLEGWDVRAHLSRIFGFANWDMTIHDLTMIYDLETTTRAGKPARKVAYRCVVSLTVRDPNGGTLATYSDGAVGESIMPDFKHGDAHDMAIKTASTQALKRCAINLGTQFGLSLYQNGNQDDVVKATLVHPDTDPTEVDVQTVPVQ
jgi:recombination DNA repair RAD52 pathway protein